MDNTKYKDKNLICLKTGAKAKIINYFNDPNASYVKVSINVKFYDTTLQVLKTVELQELGINLSLFRYQFRQFFNLKKCLYTSLSPTKN